MGEHDLGLNRTRSSVHRCSADGIAPRWIAAVGPVEKTALKIQIEIDRLRQLIEQQLDITSRGVTLSPGYLQPGPEDSSQASIVRALLGPIELAAFHIDGNPNTPPRHVRSVRLTLSGLNQRLDTGT